METKINWSIQVLKKNINKNNELDLSKVVDMLEFEIALAYLQNIPAQELEELLK